MFKQRLLATLVLVPLVLAAIYYANYWVFGAAILLLVAGCSVEWLQLIPIKNTFAKAAFLILILVTSYFIEPILDYWLLAGILLWLVILGFVLQYPPSQVIWGHPWVIGLFCLLLLPLFARSMMGVFLMEHGRALVMYILFLVWAADIGAYLAGKQWGNKKLIPAVSPGKTFEGAVGGFLFSMLVAVVGFFYFTPNLPFNWFLVAIVVALISLLGDLFISMLKRRAQIKDTGQLIPGHGGVLDRLDSLIAAVPFFYCGLLFLPPGI